MRNALIPLTLFLLSLTAACDADDLDTVDDDPSAEARIVFVPKPAEIPDGSQWGPCDLTGVNEPGWWGCNGGPGVGLACARPASDNGLNICVPQTWDPAIDDDCGNVNAPFGLGVRVQGSAYCVADCFDDSDCANGMACAASHMCAWIGE